MNILPTTPENIREAIGILTRGGIVAHATETCYGLACDITNPQAVTLLFQMKQRPNNQPVSALFSSVNDARQYVEWTERAEELAKEHLPGPLTLILPIKNDAPQKIFPTPDGSKTVGVRVSSHLIAQELVTGTQRPLTTTSANLHGQRNPYDVRTIVAQFEAAALQPDLILDSGILPEFPPSTVIDLTKDANILRKGSISPL